MGKKESQALRFKFHHELEGVYQRFCDEIAQSGMSDTVEVLICVPGKSILICPQYGAEPKFKLFYYLFQLNLTKFCFTFSRTIFFSSH